MIASWTANVLPPLSFSAPADEPGRGTGDVRCSFHNAHLPSLCLMRYLFIAMRSMPKPFRMGQTFRVLLLLTGPLSKARKAEHPASETAGCSECQPHHFGGNAELKASTVPVAPSSDISNIFGSVVL